MMNRLRIYDIDGTITKPDHDLWYLTTRSLSSNPEKFDRYVKLWKQSLNNGESPHKSSQWMMQKGIECLGENITGHLIKQQTKEICKDIIKNNQYYSGAINHICASIEANFAVIFSTTNYGEGAEAFLEILVEEGLIKEHHQDKIIVSGSIINWKTPSITHFNMGKDKNVGLSKALEISLNQLSHYTDSAYGDDPQGNDIGILSLSTKAFVILNQKNSQVPMGANIIRTSWQDILENYF